MGFFKKLIKGVTKGVGTVVRGVSIKNAIKLATGQGGEVVDEFKGRIREGFQQSVTGGLKAINPLNSDNKTVRQTVQDFSDKNVDFIASKVVGSTGTGKTADALNTGLMKIGSRAWIQQNKWIWLLLIPFIGIPLWLIMRKKSRYGRTSPRRR